MLYEWLNKLVFISIIRAWIIPFNFTLIIIIVVYIITNVAVNEAVVKNV